MKRIIYFLLVLVLLFGVQSSVAMAEKANPEMSIAYCNISFRDTVCIKYAVKTNVSDVKILIWNSPRTEYSIGTHDSEITEYYIENISGAPYMIFDYTSLSAKQMADVVYACAYAQIDGIDYYSKINKYSILQYAYNKLGKTATASTDAELKEMLANMLAYGASAQKYFDYKEDRLSTADWYQVKVSEGMLDDGFTHGLYLAGEKVTLKALETASNGSVFSHWEDSNGNQVATTATYELTMGTTNEVYTAVYKQPEHTVVIDAAVPATCTTTGLTEGKHCSTCGMVIVEQEVIPAAHNFMNQICSACGEHQYFVFTLLEDDTYSIEAKDPNILPETLILPSTFNGKPVTQIPRSAFENCNTIERLLIPESITRIGWYAFRNCENISQIVYNATECLNVYADNIRGLFDGAGRATDGIRVVIGANVKRIPPYLFAIEDNYVNVAEVEFMEGSVCEEIGFSAFHGCKNLQSIVLPDSVVSIDIGAFVNCRALESITIPAGVTSLSHNTFTNCENLTDIYYGGTKDQWQEMSIGAWNDPILSAKKHYANTEYEYFDFVMLADGTYSISAKDTNAMPDEVILPSSYNGIAVTQIGDAAFQQCHGLISITIPAGITSIGNDTFSSCVNLKSVNLPAGLTQIGAGAFSNCSELRGISIPNSVTSIGPNAFYVCTSFTGVCLPSGISYIPADLFYGCYNLISVRIPAGITRIDRKAFAECTSLTNIYFKGTEENWQEVYVDEGNDYLLNAAITCKQELMPTPDEYFTFTLLDNGTYSIRINSPENMPSEVVIPSYYNGKPVTVIEEWGFCPDRSRPRVNNITSIIIPDSIIEIGMAAFSDCSNLTSIVIPEGVDVLNISVFQRCTNLKSIYLPYKLQGIYDTVFLHCDNLTDIYYMGTEEMWQEIGIGDWNDPFDNKTVSIHYNSVYG